MTKRGFCMCPWCDWTAESVGRTVEEAVADGQRLIREHNEQAGHRVKHGRDPRPGYRKGAPIQ